MLILCSLHSCTLHNLLTVCGIFNQFYKNVYSLKTMCRTQKWLFAIFLASKLYNFDFFFKISCTPNKSVTIWDIFIGMCNTIRLRWCVVRKNDCSPFFSFQVMLLWLFFQFPQTSCTPHNSVTVWNIFMKLYRKVYQVKTMFCACKYNFFPFLLFWVDCVLCLFCVVYIFGHVHSITYSLFMVSSCNIIGMCIW